MESHLVRITETYLFKSTLLKPHIYTVELGFAVVFTLFLTFAPGVGARWDCLTEMVLLGTRSPGFGVGEENIKILHL